jgi:predicted transcriptional regulator
MTEPQTTDSEMLRVAATHPRVDLLKLLSKSDDNGYSLCKELGIPYRACFSHLRMLEKSGLIGGKIRYHITEKGKQMLCLIQHD